MESGAACSRDLGRGTENEAVRSAGDGESRTDFRAWQRNLTRLRDQESEESQIRQENNQHQLCLSSNRPSAGCPCWGHTAEPLGHTAEPLGQSAEPPLGSSGEPKSVHGGTQPGGDQTPHSAIRDWLLPPISKGHRRTRERYRTGGRGTGHRLRNGSFM